MNFIGKTSIYKNHWHTFCQQKLAMFMFLLLMSYIAVALLVWWGLLAGNWAERVGTSYSAPSFEHLFGTDLLGRDVLRKVIFGAKNTCFITLFGLIISIGLGTVLGAAAGYFGRVVDFSVVWVYTVISAVPGILLIIAFAFVFRDISLFGLSLDGAPAICLALGLTGWVGTCRLVRSEVLKIRESEYIMAATAIGCSKLRILFRHILPGVTHLVIIQVCLHAIGFINAEVILGFLGFGSLNQPSWGGMIDEGRIELSRGVWWQLLPVCLIVFVLSLAFNIIGDTLRDSFDPRLSEK